jgi:CxxC motif-containing protein
MKEYVCIICPNGCEITVEAEGGRVTKVSGNLCPKGDAYVRKELSSPERGVTSTVAVNGGRLPLVSVKATRPVPKDMVFAVMDAVSEVVVAAPVKIGQVVLKDAAGTGADIVATRNVGKKQSDPH